MLHSVGAGLTNKILNHNINILKVTFIMKKSLLALAAGMLLAGGQMNAAYYLIGNNVDGSTWALGTNEMVEQEDGTFKWEGEVLGTQFKVNDGTWSGDNFGSNGSALELGVAYSYVNSGSSGNIEFDGLSEVSNPVVVLDVVAGTITVTGKGTEDNPDADTWGICGAATGWATDLDMTDEGNGVWSYTGALSGEFKFRANGGWVKDFGAGADAVLTVDGVYEVVAGGQNFSIEAENVTLTLDVNNKTLTVAGLEGGGIVPPAPGDEKWFCAWDITGGVWEFGNEMSEQEDGTFKIHVDATAQETNYFAVFYGEENTGWESGTRYVPVGNVDEVVDHSETIAMEQGYDGAWVLAQGEWTVVVNPATLEISFEEGNTVGVAAIEAANGEAVYFNMQGVRVANPENGLYIRVQNGKAVKVVK